MPVCCTCCCCCLSRLNGWINWQLASVGWGCMGAWQVATVASGTLNCKTPRIYQQCQQQIDFKANGETDRQTDTHTSSKLPLATIPFLPPAPQSATQLNVEAPERHYLLTFTDCLGFLFFSLSLTHIFSLSLLSLLFAIAE